MDGGRRGDFSHRLSGFKNRNWAQQARQRRHQQFLERSKQRRQERLQARRDPLGEIKLGMSNTHWQGFVTRTARENRESLASNVQEVRRRPELSSFVYDRGGTKVEHQVKYGPSANIRESHQRWLKQRYGANVGKRFSQYSSTRMNYVRSAQATGRPLTLQERDVSRGQNPGRTSINHIIASGTGQNMLNRMAVQHAQGVEQFNTARQGDNQRGMLAGLAKQAAAVGRMRGIGRGLLAEETPQQGYGAGMGGMLSPSQRHIAKRNRMSSDIHTAFEGANAMERLGAYKSYMKNTFDSVGNLRLGHGTGNGRVSTGFDMPLTSTQQPTPRGKRLYEVNMNYGMPEMERSAKVTFQRAKFRSGIFTTNTLGKKLSSSRHY